MNESKKFHEMLLSRKKEFNTLARMVNDNNSFSARFVIVFENFLTYVSTLFSQKSEMHKQARANIIGAMKSRNNVSLFDVDSEQVKEPSAHQSPDTYSGTNPMKTPNTQGEASNPEHQAKVTASAQRMLLEKSKSLFTRGASHKPRRPGGHEGA